jgi:hypothetical protein
MKKLYFILSFVFLTTLANAQDNQPPTQKTQQDIEALKVAFISRELDLTPDEAQKFWPVYNQYSKEFNAAVKDNHDVLDRDEKVLNIRKKYRDQFARLLGQDRMNRMFGAEGRFHKLLIKAMRKQNGSQQNRPMMNRRRFQ